MKATLTGYIANTSDETEIATRTYIPVRTLEEACEDARETLREAARRDKDFDAQKAYVNIWRIGYEFEAEVNDDGYLIVDGQGYGPAGDESSLNNEDWGYRCDYITQLPDYSEHWYEFVEEVRL